MLESLLINFLILLVPVICFLLFLENRFYTYRTGILLFLTSISIVLCMKFPIILNIGYIVDLRYVPFVIFALFTGYRNTFILFLVINVYRFYIGGEGAYQSLAFSTIMFLVVPLFNKWFIKQSPKKRILYAVLFAVMTMVFYLFTLLAFWPEINEEYWILAWHALTTHAFVMGVIMMFLEQIIANRNAREKLFQADRYDIISDLMASVAHEIRNPLTVTKGFLQLLNESQSITKAEKKYIEYSLVELKRAEGIVSDFLAFSKSQSENMLYSDLKEETEYVKNILTPYANMYQVEIHERFQNTLKFHYDKNQIQQCLINLCKNAIEAMRETGGVLTIDVSENNNLINIQIKDTGIGMTEDEIKQLGRPYYSSKKEGTGLGMLMIYSTINKLNGKIEVESEKGQGTTFYISIPVE